MAEVSPIDRRDVTDTYSPLEHLVLQVIQADRYDGYCEWVPAWVDEQHGKRAKAIAEYLSRQFVVTCRDVAP